MKRLVLLAGLLVAFSGLSYGQRVIVAGEKSPGIYGNVPVNASNYLLVDCPGCTGASAPAGASNADGIASAGTGLAPVQAYNFGYNGTTWDRLRVDGSQNLKVNCASGCAGGSFNNNADGVATSATNGQTAAWMYGYNGATWDRLQVDASKFLKVAVQNASFVVTNAGTFATQATQAGTWNITNVSGTVSLPTLAATSTKQSDGTQKTQIVDGSGSVIASTSNNLNVQCANCSGSGVSTADAASFTAGTSLFAGSGGFFQTTATSNALTNGQQGMLQLTAQRAAFANLRNASGTEVGTSGAPLRVDVTGTTTQPVSLTSTTITGTVAATQSGTWTVQPGNTANTTAWKVDGSAVTQPVSGTVSITTNSAVNVAQVGGTAVVADPCQAIAKISLPISQATSTQLITGTSAKKTYICSLMLIAGAAENVAITAGTGTVCATGAAAIIGSTTVANGLILAANGGFTMGSGVATVAAGLTNADNICLLQSGSVRVSGVLTYVQQ